MSYEIRDKADKVYMVVGCHGSATSLIVQGLRKCDIAMGRWLIEKVYEPAAIRKLNNRILEAAGGSWYDPPSEEAILRLHFGEEIQSVLRQYDSETMWGFKDPRLSLAGRLYLPHLNGDSYLFCCFRRPDRLLESLSRRWRERPWIEHINKELIDRYNRGIVSLIEDFCELT